MVKLLLVGFAGFIGTIGRYWLSESSREGTVRHFRWALPRPG